MMKLKKIIYASRAVHPMSEAELVDLLSRARTRNQAAGVTGMLLYAGQSFLQMLEGDAASLEHIYASISRDPRHNALRLLAEEPIGMRRFTDWSMGFDHIDEDRLGNELPGYRSATDYPLVSANLVRNGAVAETLLGLFARNDTPGVQARHSA